MARIRRHKSNGGKQYHIVAHHHFSRFANDRDQLDVRQRLIGVASIRAVGDLAVADFYIAENEAGELDSTLDSTLSILEGEAAAVFHHHLDAIAFRPHDYSMRPSGSASTPIRAAGRGGGGNLRLGREAARFTVKTGGVSATRMRNFADRAHGWRSANTGPFSPKDIEEVRFRDAADASYPKPCRVGNVAGDLCLSNEPSSKACQATGLSFWRPTALVEYSAGKTRSRHDTIADAIRKVTLEPNSFRLANLPDLAPWALVLR